MKQSKAPAGKASSLPHGHLEEGDFGGLPKHGFLKNAAPPAGWPLSIPRGISAHAEGHALRGPCRAVTHIPQGGHWQACLTSGETACHRSLLFCTRARGRYPSGRANAGLAGTKALSPPCQNQRGRSRCFLARLVACTCFGMSEPYLLSSNPHFFLSTNTY